MNDRRHVSLSVPGMAALLCAAFTPLATADGNQSGPAPDTNLLGAQLLQHALSIPAPLNPFADETGANCGLGQRGHVWFLHTTLGNPFGEPVQRECTIPVGKTIFINIMSWTCIPFPNETVEQNIQICKEANDVTDTLLLRINGKTRNDLIKRRASTHAFALPLPDDNIYGLPATVAVAVHDGYYATLPELPLGHHTIRAQGGSTQEGFATDVHYRLHIVKPVKVP